MKNITYINAGAGSGKTYTLTNILAEKLAAKDEQGNSVIKPSQVILTTFTELAATEFREKARQKILAADNIEAASQIDSAAIGTVHSVALNFIKKFWYLLDYGADIQIITERDADFYLSQSLARIMSERDENGNLKKQEDLNNFRKFRDLYDISDGYGHPNYHFWEQILHEIVEKMEYYNVDDVEESIDKSIATLRQVFTAESPDVELIFKGLTEYINFLSPYPEDTAKNCVKTGTPLLKTKKKDFKWLIAVSEFLSKLCKPATALKECPTLNDSLVESKSALVSKTHLDYLEPYINSIFHLAKEWRDDFITYKKRNHIISYNDMERLFLKLITENQEVMDYIRDNYRLVMVDEFQDSNPIQLKIFNQLSELIAPSGGHSYWVGDPKQAIYGFRGADTELVNSVAKHFTFYNDAQIHPEEGENCLGSGRLVESWRSRSTLVHLVNYVFADKFKGEINELCITLEPHFKDDTLNTPAIVHWNTIGSNIDKNAAAVAIQVKKLLNSGMHVHSGKQDEAATPIQPKDIAILCKKNSTVSKYVKALRNQNVPVSESEDAIMQRIEIQLVVSLLMFMQNPNNKHVIADLMRLLWGKTTQEILRNRIDYTLENINEDGRLEDDQWQLDSEQVQNLQQFVGRFKNLSIPEMVRGLIYEGNIIELCAKWGEEAIRRQNLSTLQHLADDYDQMCLQMGLGTSITGFINYLNMVEPDKEKDNQSNTVKVFTYHGSKGLEWPVVILNELNDNRLDDNELIKKGFMHVREVMSKDEATSKDPFAKSYFLHYFPFTLKSINNKPSENLVSALQDIELYQKLKDRTRSEERRLMYVGMTRAKDYLFSTGKENAFDWLTNIGISNPTKENVWDWSEQDIECIELPDNEEISTEPTAETFLMDKKPEKHTTYAERYISPSKISTFEGYNSHRAWNEHGMEMVHTGWGTEYDVIGTCIHDIFAIFQPGNDESNRKAAIGIISGYALTDKLIGSVDAILRSANWLYEQLQEHFPQKADDRIDREYPFMMTCPSGETLRGEMDLLWHYSDESGKHCVLVDYKTYPGVSLHDHTKTHYAQLSAYAAALKAHSVDVAHALIYYPIHATIHELTK